MSDVTVWTMIGWTLIFAVVPGLFGWWLAPRIFREDDNTGSGRDDG